MENKEWVKYIKDKKLITIDPGKEGGIVVFSLDRKEIIMVTHMPETPQDLLNFITRYQKNATCYLEKVGGLPGMGGSSMFNFGKGFGHLEMALLCRKIPTMEVTPQKWQKELQLGTKGKKTTTQWKTKLKERAQQLYPNVGAKFNLKTKQDWMRVSDALLILEYARITEKRR